jgi:hypothetical protein
MNSRIGVVIVGHMATLLSAGALAGGFKVTGSMSYSWNVARKSYNETVSFEASTLGRSWLVRIEQSGGRETVAGSDGRDFYCLVMAPHDAAAREMGRYPGWVCHGTYPLMSRGILVGLPWLALCSAGFLARHQTNGDLTMPAPWLPAEYEPLAHIYTEKYDVLPGGSGLPKRVEFHPDPSRMDELRRGICHTLLPVSDSARDRSVIKLAQYAGVSQAKAVYEVTKTMRCGSWVIPGEFLFRINNFYHRTNLPPRAVASTIVTGRVASAVSIGTLSPLPESSDDIRNVQVADYRFCDIKRGVGFVPYVATNSAWRTNMSDPFLQSRLQRQLRLGQRFVNQPRYSKAFVLLALVLAVVTPLLASNRLREALIRPLLGPGRIAGTRRDQP